MSRSFAVFCLASAGVFVLAGVGWALVAGAVLALVLWPRDVADDRVLAFARWAAGSGQQFAARVRSAPRRVTAATGMGAGVVLLPAGVGVVAGAGVAVAVFGVLLIGFSLLTGWGA